MKMKLHSTISALERLRAMTQSQIILNLLSSVAFKPNIARRSGIASTLIKARVPEQVGEGVRDYGMKNIISFGVGGIQWVKKLAFDNR